MNDKLFYAKSEMKPSNRRAERKLISDDEFFNGDVITKSFMIKLCKEKRTIRYSDGPSHCHFGEQDPIGRMKTGILPTNSNLLLHKGCNRCLIEENGLESECFWKERLRMGSATGGSSTGIYAMRPSAK
uniref:Uncharacterized protein n=1 Tax=Angiostrongylus cantonensis TaxID=6313 RepID=A0A0K0DCM6_ANGCA